MPTVFVTLLNRDPWPRFASWAPSVTPQDKVRLGACHPAAIENAAHSSFRCGSRAGGTFSLEAIHEPTMLLVTVPHG